jgi:hypothetical protein
MRAGCYLVFCLALCLNKCHCEKDDFTGKENLGLLLKEKKISVNTHSEHSRIMVRVHGISNLTEIIAVMGEILCTPLPVLCTPLPRKVIQGRTLKKQTRGVLYTSLYFKLLDSQHLAN